MMSVAQRPELVECVRHYGEECPRCDGSGYRSRKRCASCGESAKSLQAAHAGSSWKEVRSLPLYCMDCNPRFAGSGLDSLLG